MVNKIFPRNGSDLTKDIYGSTWNWLFPSAKRAGKTIFALGSGLNDYIQMQLEIQKIHSRFWWCFPCKYSCSNENIFLPKTCFLRWVISGTLNNIVESKNYSRRNAQKNRKRMFPSWLLLAHQSAGFETTRDWRIPLSVLFSSDEQMTPSKCDRKWKSDKLSKKVSYFTFSSKNGQMSHHSDS